MDTAEGELYSTQQAAPSACSTRYESHFLPGIISVTELSLPWTEAPHFFDSLGAGINSIPTIGNQSGAFLFIFPLFNFVIVVVLLFLALRNVLNPWETFFIAVSSSTSTHPLPSSRKNLPD